MRGLVVCALAGLLAAEAGAYRLYRTPNGQPFRWALGENAGHPIIEVRLTPDEPRELTSDEAYVAMVHAFSAWSPLVCDGVVLRAEIDPGEPNERSRQGNTVRWVTEPEDWGEDESVIAITHLLVDLDTGEILDADIDMNNVHYSFSFFPGGADRDAVATLVHEAGHFFGLDHSDDPNAVMWPRELLANKQAGRILGQDDINGWCALQSEIIERRAFESASCGSTPRPGSGSWLLLLVFSVLAWFRLASLAERQSG